MGSPVLPVTPCFSTLYPSYHTVSCYIVLYEWSTVLHYRPNRTELNPVQRLTTWELGLCSNAQRRSGWKGRTLGVDGKGGLASMHDSDDREGEERRDKGRSGGRRGRKRTKRGEEGGMI